VDWIATMQAREAETIARLRWLIEHESPTDSKPDVDRLGRALAERGAALGATVETLPQERFGDLIRLEWPGRGDGQTLVLTHIDTVWPLGSLQAMPYRVDDGRVYGPGSLDMKAGVAMLLTALEAFQEAGRAPARRLVWLITSEEEIGSPVSRPAIESLARASDYVLVLEPGQGKAGALKTSRKGVGLFTLSIAGRAAHAGLEPGRGVSAVEELAHQVLRLHGLTDLAAGTSVNVGIVRGGSRRNVVAAEAVAEIDLRIATMAEAERIVPAIQGLTPVLPGTRLTITGGVNRPPMERTPAGAAAYERVRAIGRRLGLALDEASSGGGSDGNFTAALGAATVDGLGGVGDGAHAAHEHVAIRSLIERGALLAALLDEL
jgi:glutamate carboxypeptidase